MPPLWTKHIDSGQSTIVFDTTGKPIKSKDAKDAQSLTAYDTLQRPTHGWSQNNGTDFLRLTAHAIYGEEVTNPKVNNLNGQLWQQYDESGKIESIAFDFKGNLLSKKQQVISSTVLKTALDNYETYLVDWTSSPSILGTQVFETSSEFDALNRVTKITLPENVNNDRKEITPTYNRAGALEKVSYDNTEYVENIAYNAKGQRLLIAFGNDIMTRYSYDNRTFRLLRQRSEKYAKTQAGNTITYTPQSGTNKQDDKYIYDLIGNIFGINIRTTACGVGGTDSLDRVFDYDPLYRVTSGTGRENVQGGNYPFPGWDDQVRSTDPNTTEAYTRQYTFDKLGNIEQVKQLGTNGFTRDFSYNIGKNSLDTVTIGSNNYNYTYDACSNQLTENTERHFEWDAANRLILFKNQVGSAEPSVIAQYLYDSSGNRVKKIVRKQGGSYEIRTYIDGVFEHYTDETDEQNTVHIMDDKSRVATIRIGDAMGDTTPAIKYNLENNIYSSAVTLDDNGAIVNTQEYYPFGETSFGSYGKKRYQYVGKERDEESGLYYYGARYYTPWIARFISCDPLSAKYAQLSPYNYSDNNPINDFDIDGMQNNNSEGSEGGKTSEIPSQNTNAQGESIPWQDGDVWQDKATGIKYTTYDDQWGIALDTVTVTPQSSKLNEVLDEIKTLVDKSIPYSQQGDRTSLSEKGLAALDCSETVSVYLKKLGIMNKDKPALYTGVMLNESGIQQAIGSKDIEFVKGSDSPNFTPQRGDIFVWRTNAGGHTGIVYDVDNDKVTILEAIGGSGSGDERFNRDNGGTAEKGISRTAVYRKSGGALSGHAGWVGYFRPIIK